MQKPIVLSICLVLAVAGFGFGDPAAGPSQSLAGPEDTPAPVQETPPVDTETKIKCLRAALGQLRTAGTDELAAKVLEQLRLEQRALQQRELTRKLAELKSLSKEIDRLRDLADSPAQVVIHVRMIEIDRRKLPLPDRKAAATNVPPFDDIRDLEMLDARVKELLRQGSINVISRPTLRAASGQLASVYVGSQFPPPKPGTIVPAAGEPELIEMPPLGVSVEVLPKSLGGARLSLDITAQERTPDMTNTVMVHGKTIPSLKVRRLSTQIELDLGHPCVLGGLRSNGPDGEKELVIILVAERVPSPSE